MAPWEHTGTIMLRSENMNENLPPVCHFIFKEKKHVIFISENIIVNYYSLKLSRLN